MYPRQREKAQREALETIRGFFTEASNAFEKDPAAAHRLVLKARRLAMKVQLTLPVALKRRYCKHCYHYLLPSVNGRVRVQKHRVIIYCLDCKHYTRIPIAKRKPGIKSNTK